MLEKLPRALGEALNKLRAGAKHLTYLSPAFADVPETLVLQSPAIDQDGKLAPRYTADGPGLSPPLSWHTIPERAASLALIIEDADSPTPQPLVHAIVIDLPPVPGMLMEGELPIGNFTDDHLQMGRNSYLRRRYLPPDPPPGHGPHSYVFQLFALDNVMPANFHPGRTALVSVISGHVLARTFLIGRYSR